MKQVTSRAHAEHYTWGAGCDGWHLTKGPALSIIEERMPAGTFEEAHRHARAEQFFFVLEGEAVMALEGARVRIAAGEGLSISPGVVHRMRNDSGADVRFLVVSHPTTRGDRENLEDGVSENASQRGSELFPANGGRDAGRPDLNRRRFRSVRNVEHGDVSSDTLFVFSQTGDVVTATYAGGTVSDGQLIALMDARGNLELRYQHITVDGSIKTGECQSTLAPLPDGRLAYDEEWRWTSGSRAEGRSRIEEVP